MLLIVDANVLIDYLKTDSSILALAARHLGVIRVASVILDEVEQLGLEDCEDLGLTVVHEPLDNPAGRCRIGRGAVFPGSCLPGAGQVPWLDMPDP